MPTLFGTVRLKVPQAKAWENELTAICDNGSSINFITQRAIQRLGLSAKRGMMSIIGLQNEPLSTTNGQIKLILQSKNHSNQTIAGIFYVIDEITQISPCEKIPQYREFEYLNLGDPEYGSPKPIDLLLGLDVWVQMLMEGMVRSKNGLAIAQKTSFGWIVFQGENNVKQILTRQVLHTSIEKEELSLKSLDETLKRFWEIESLPTSKLLTIEERECERIFADSHSRRIDGRYVVYLPLNKKLKTLGKSKQIALRQFFSTERRRAKNEQFQNQYIAFMQEFEKLGHLSKIIDAKEDGYYTPHHGVCSSKKFRVVFNASCPTTSGISLNDCQLVGEKLQNDLQNIFLKFRVGEIALTADIIKMYRQVEVHEHHRKFQKILWRCSPDEPVDVYQINRVVYGQAAAPHLAVRAMQQCAQDHKMKYPLGAEAVLNAFYVDDLLTCTDSKAEAIKLKNEIIQLLQKGKFELSKWCSNRSINSENSESKYVDFGPVDDFSKLNVPWKPKTMEIASDDVKFVLGLRWLPKEDDFVYIVNPIESSQEWTKRKILSEIGKLYDPSGFIAPIIIRAKIFIQTLWQSGVDWDEKISEQLEMEWLEFLDSLSNLQEIKIPRWLGMKATWKTDLHFFSDASERAYAAVAYARTIHLDGKITVRLIQSKTRVAPLKRLTIPRLELCGAYLSANLVEVIAEQFANQFETCHLWSDSEVTLAWIRKPPNQLKTFIGNRVATIQTKTTDRGYKWHWVAGEDNPADLASRGTNPQLLNHNDLWWNGPKWLEYSEKMWPKMEPRVDEVEDVIASECRVVLHVTTAPRLMRNRWFKSKQLVPIIPLLQAYSCLSKLQRVTATVLRAINNFKSKDKLTGPLSEKEMNQAMLTLVQIDQYQTFRKEIEACSLEETVSNGSIWFDPETKVLRLRGRVISENLSFDEQNPILLSPKGDLAPLIVHEAHLKTLHGGVQQVLQLVRRHFWIQKARQSANKMVRNCVVCFRHKMRVSQQLMAALPTARTKPNRPFKTCGVDYMGPVGILTKIGRSPRITKGYVCVFVCFVTRAVHLELVSDASTPQFMQALRRLIARRGPVKEIWSDNGTNFVGANNEMNRIFEGKVSAQSISDQFQIKWHFITPLAPHHGGLHEAAVKSVKKHLLRVIGAQNLTFEEYNTLLTQVEACVNSRPIAPQSDDPADLTALTPAHFLIGEPLITLIEPGNLTEARTSYLKRWQLVQQMYQNFWQRWHVEYVTTLANRPKWRTRERNLQTGDLVLVREENVPPSQWCLGRIKETFVAPDGCVRSVLISTINGDFKRPITKLGLLLEESDENTDLSNLNAKQNFLNLKH